MDDEEILQVPLDLADKMEEFGLSVEDLENRLATIEADKKLEQWIQQQRDRVDNVEKQAEGVVGENAVKSADTDGDECLQGGVNDDYSRFRLDYTNTLTVTVKNGIYEYNSSDTTRARYTPAGDTAITGVGNSFGGFAGTFSAGTLDTPLQHYVYLEKVAANRWPVARADRVQITCSETDPYATGDAVFSEHIYDMIGTFTTTNSLVDQSSIVRYNIKDRDDTALVPDSIVPASFLNHKTITAMPDTDGVKYSAELTLHNSYKITLEGASSNIAWNGRGIPVLDKNITPNPLLEWFGIDSDYVAQRSIEFCSDVDYGGERGLLQLNEMASPDVTPANAAAWANVGFCYRTSVAGVVHWVPKDNILDEYDWTGETEDIGTDLNTNNYIHHTDLDFTNVGSGWAAIGVGKSGGNTDQDDSYWHAFNDNSSILGHDAFIDSKTYKTSGLLEVTNTTAMGDGVGAFVTAGGIYTANGIYAKRGTGAGAAGYFWDGATTQSYVSGSGYGIHVDGSGLLGDAAYNAYFGVTGDAYAAMFQGNSAATSVQMATATRAIDATAGRINSADGYSWAGDDFSLIDASDLRPTDKIMVIR